MTEIQKHPLVLYLPEELVQQLDQTKGPFSRAKLIELLLAAAIRKGINLSEIVGAS